jgi:HECT-domain (ubiquitin-transferase)
VYEGVKQELDNFLKGIHSVIGAELLEAFDVEEFEFFLCGESKIDVTDWKSNTKYRGNLSEKSQIVKWFWKIVSELDDKNKRKLLQFCTGCSRVPAEGFGYSCNVELYRVIMARFANSA